MVRSRQGKGNVNRGLREGQWKVKVRSRQRKHNLSRNYNLMGFDTIEINLVHLPKMLRFGLHQIYQRAHYICVNWEIICLLGFSTNWILWATLAIYYLL